MPRVDFNYAYFQCKKRPFKIDELPGRKQGYLKSIERPGGGDLSAYGGLKMQDYIFPD